MSSDWARGMFDRLTINPRRTTAAAARKKSMQEAIPGLPDHLVVEHIVRSEYFDDPADLARLPAVSRAMRAAVAATGLQFVQLDEEKALKLGCLSALQRLQRQGRLSRQENLCAAAARSGLLEELKVLRANGCPWDWRTCSGACPWDWRTCSGAAEGGNLEVLQWARANGCYWDANTLGRKHVLRGGGGRSPRGAAVGARERLFLERVHVRGGGGGRSPRVASVGARERLSMGRGHVHGVDGGERL